MPSFICSDHFVTALTTGTFLYFFQFHIGFGNTVFQKETALVSVAVTVSSDTEKLV